MIAVLVHMGLELSGGGFWACLRGRCNHTHHRVLGDVALCLLMAVLTVRLVG